MQTPKIPPPCFEFLKGSVVDFSGNNAVFRYTPVAEMENPYGLVQGGILCGMLDNIIGTIIFMAAPERASSTIQMTTNFLRAAKPGESLIARGTLVKLGRTQAYIEATLERESDGELVAKASATNVFLDKKP